MSIKSFQVGASHKPIKSEIIIFDSKKKKDYKNKIVIIKSLEPANLVFNLRKAKAIISEKGAITSHGSIIAREFKIPVIIIKDAQKIFKEKEIIAIKENGIIEKEGQKSELIKYCGFKHKKVRFKKMGIWVFVKPRQHSPLRLSLVERGIKNIPRILMGSKKIGEYKFTNKGYWYKNVPSPDKLAYKIIYQPKWFKRKLQQRNKIFDELKKYLKNLQKKFKKTIIVQEATEELKTIKKYYTKLRPFTYLTQVAIDSLEKDFYNLITSIDTSDEFKEWLNKALTPKISRKIISNTPELLKRFHYLNFPPPNPNFKLLNLEIKKTKIPQKLKEEFKKHPQKKLISRYLETLPLAVQLSEEAAYWGRVLKIFTLNILYILALELKKRKKIKKIQDIENLTVEELIEIIQKDKPISKIQLSRLKKIKFRLEPK